jgi:hypothetical protein
MKMMEALFVVAEMQEAQSLIEHYKMKKQELSCMNLWSNDVFQLIVTGAGVNNVISSLSKAISLGILNSDVNIINVGYAGAKGIDVGCVVNVKACSCFEFPTKANTSVKNHVKLSDEGYNCYTSIDFVEKADNVEEKALFDMELAYIARFVYRSLYSIKIVSDNLDYDDFKEFNGEESWKKAIDKIEERRKASVSGYITA